LVDPKIASPIIFHLRKEIGHDICSDNFKLISFYLVVVDVAAAVAAAVVDGGVAVVVHTK